MKSTLLNITYRLFNLMGVQVLFSKKSSTQLTAVQAKQGFWYIGNLFNRADISYGIFQNGFVEEDEGKTFITLVDAISNEKPDPVIYDVGAHTGYYSLLSASHNSKARIYAFEPVSEYFEITEKNIKLNSYDGRIKAFKVGLSDSNGSADISLAGSGSSLNTDMVVSDNKETIVTTTLDSLIQKEGIPKPDIMKIDVESHELAMLNGMKDVLNSAKPILYMEIIKEHNGKVNAKFEETFIFLKNAGYKIYRYKIVDGKVTFTTFDPNNSSNIPRLEMYTCIHASSNIIAKLPIN